QAVSDRPSPPPSRRCGPWPAPRRWRRSSGSHSRPAGSRRPGSGPRCPPSSRPAAAGSPRR
ncbi:MAG: hypothetical protein EON85_04050, partial [Brevundimonas sp.]